MLTFEKWTKIAGYSVGILLFFVLFLIFFNIVEKQTVTQNKITKISEKVKANSIDVWRFIDKGRKKYHLKADSMDKLKNDVVILHNARLWLYEPKKPVIYMRSDKAVIYKNNDIDASGKVYLKREDLQLYDDSIKWINKDKIAESSEPFKGSSKKSSFSGKSFVYYQNKDKLVARGVSIWLR